MHMYIYAHTLYMHECIHTYKLDTHNIYSKDTYTYTYIKYELPIARWKGNIGGEYHPVLYLATADERLLVKPDRTELEFLNVVVSMKISTFQSTLIPTLVSCTENKLSLVLSPPKLVTFTMSISFFLRPEIDETATASLNAV